MFTAIRRQIVPAIGVTVAMILLCCIAYPALTWIVGDVAFHSKIYGSYLSSNGQPVGSKLIGQSFTDAAGVPLPQYFQPRPSDTSTSPYDPAAGSGASNLGPSDPRLIGFVPGVNALQIDGSAFPAGSRPYNPFATPADPYCVPMSAPTSSSASAPVYQPASGDKYAVVNGTYVCDPNTVPERALAYRQLNGLRINQAVPVDAVTASASGLDPDISPLNAEDQALRVERVRHLPSSEVAALIKKCTSGRSFGFLGEPVVNVVELNLALDQVSGRT